jgi:SAM-dependent methyltransferase
MPKTIHFYHEQAIELNAQYNSVLFEEVHPSWSDFWPRQNCSVLDIGAGNGRDAKWFAERGSDVVAVEPAQALRELGKSQTPLKIHWLDDQLPELNKVFELGIRFDVILLSAVWMHIAPNDRERCFRKLSNLLAPNGKLIISLRFGVFKDARKAYPVSAEELQSFAKRYALIQEVCTSINSDELGRSEVNWQTLVFRLPNGGSGSLTKIRKIIVNDNKTSTYKLALLRTLCRIADAHPGAITDRSDGKIAIPLGLVALYWIRLYKRLIDKYQLQQSSNPNLGLGFVKEDSWNKLRHLGADDLAIGSIYLGNDAIALHNLLKDTISTMIKGPVRFIYHGESSNTLFEIQRKTVKAETKTVLNKEYLHSFGDFNIDETMWNCLQEYSSWIDPLLIQQWIREMQKYTLNNERKINLEMYHNGLAWLEESHDTSLVRKKIQQLKTEQKIITSVWSNTKLNDTLHIDHCIPFAYWPNNDKWNLLPATVKENLSKSDRIPSKSRMNEAKSRILDWWELAWDTEQEQARFFHEASLSLATFNSNSTEFEEVFDALHFQIYGVKQRLQINEW